MKDEVQGSTYMGTAATESIRIAEKFLPNASLSKRKALAMEICDAINLCESELAQEIVAGLKGLEAKL